jgi:hypothetical protein
VRKLLIALVVLVLLLVLADRAAAFAAESIAAGDLRNQLNLTQKPDVTVHGWPFLTQLADGRYDDIEVSAHDVDVSQLAGLSVDVHLIGAHIPAGDVIHRRVSNVPVDRVQGQVTVPYADIASASKVPGLQLHKSGDGVAITAPLTVFGQRLSITATATVAVSGDALRIGAQAPKTGQGSLAGAALSQVLGALSFEVPLGRLPFGVQVTDVHPAAAGIVAAGRVDHVVLRRDALLTAP